MFAMPGSLKLLILGGYGTFGGRLAQLLADESRLTILIAGRSHAKASTFCSQLPASATLIPCVVDRDGDLEAQIKTLAPDVLVDATGPFQNYGDDPYRVIQACIALGISYLDLADGSDFVKGVQQFDEAATARGIFVLSGVSSFPVLTAAVVRHLAQGMAQLHTIQGGIAPSPYAGVGENVIRAIAGYAGQPVKLWRGGKQATGYALTETMRYTIAPPGKLPLRNIRFSLVDVPDLQVIPEAWPGLDSIWMGAGPVPEILHRALNYLSWLVRWRLIPSLTPAAKLFYHAINLLRWGEHRGGMFVAVEGIGDQGQTIMRSWHLLAEGSDGPLIPSMAIEAIIRHMLEGKIPPFGARAATKDLELTDYEALFTRRTIYTGSRDDSPVQSLPLYQYILGDAWHQLPASIGAMHDLHTTKSVEGFATVTRGKNIFAKIIAKLFGFPKAGSNIPVRVDFSVKNGKEYWQRTFAEKTFLSIQSQGHGRYANLICERFGLCNFGLAIVADGTKLHLIIRRWDILGIPLPLCLAPGGHSYESEDGDKFHFHVEITLPFIGLVVRYEGWLVSSRLNAPPVPHKAKMASFLRKPF